MQHQPIVIFGEVLWDCFPDGNRVLGGAPFNVAWHLQAFGRSPLLISRVGKDHMGDLILTEMSNWGMNLAGIQADLEHGTGAVAITLNEGQPQYEIEYPKAYDFIEVNHLEKIEPSPLLYHGSLALRNHISCDALLQLKNDLNGTVFFDVNLRSPWWDKTQIETLLKKTTWLKLNDEELPLIVPERSTMDAQIEFIFANYALDYVLLTQGAAGATLIEKSGDRRQITPQRNDQVVDTVGAGDAFCSILLLGITSGWSLEITLERAQTFASAIVSIQGATTKNRDFYQSFQEAWQ
jgi:fructokinase